MSDDATKYQRLTKIEGMMQNSLAKELQKAVKELKIIDDFSKESDPFAKTSSTRQMTLFSCIESFPAQIVLTAMQILWAQRVEDRIKKSKREITTSEELIEKYLILQVKRVLTNLQKDVRQKYEKLITDLVHQRDTTRHLIDKKVQSIEDFSWLYHMRYYLNEKEKEGIKKVTIIMTNEFIYYGFEHLGVREKLVKTPLTDRCYLTLTQALHFRLGEIHLD